MLDLMALDAKGVRSGPKPQALELDDITVMDALFQPRESSLLFRAGASADHVKELARVVTQGRLLAPLVVTAFGSAWVLLDGHHRHQAYLEANYKKPVPVLVAECRLRGESRVRWAATTSVELNSRDKLAMSPRDKMEAAWRLTVLEAGSKKEIMRASNASISSIANMRQTRSVLLESGREPEELTGMTWRDAKWARHCLENEDRGERPEYRDARLGQLIVGLSAHVTKTAPPLDLLLDALEEVRPGLLQDLIVMQERREEEAEEEAKLATIMGILDI